MNRPKKNNIKNPTIADDQQDQLDERNLIDAEDSEEISFEDRVQMYWMDNKGFVSSCVLVLAITIIAFNGMRIYKGKVEKQLQASYSEAQKNETLADFAKSNSNDNLGGLAALTVADEAYTAGEFDQSLEFYSIANRALRENLLSGRAQVGEAFSRFYGGDESGALKQLAGIADDNTLPEASRIEAAYHLAVDANVSDDQELYERYVAQIQDSKTATQWQQRLAMYESQAR